MAEEKMEMTQEGLDKLEAELRELLDVERPRVIEALKLARSQGDLSENADYDAARNRQAEIEARIQEIEHIKDIAVIIDTSKAARNSRISLGKRVVYKETATGEKVEVRIVGTVEADAFAVPPAISNDSALGKALVGRVKGDHVIVESASPYEIEILSVTLD